MRNKDYREIQLSSSHLVFIFIGILILGLVVFVLGVSVGKKQAQIIKATELPSEAKLEEVKEKPVTPTEKPKGTISKELASHQKIRESTQKKVSAGEKGNFYYIQVGAFQDRKVAFSFAQKFKKRGYSPLVLNPLPSDKKPFYRVRLGVFKTREEADALKQKLIQAEKRKKSDYFIVRK